MRNKGRPHPAMQKEVVARKTSNPFQGKFEKIIQEGIQ
jgi:hypothetical protein